MAPRPSRRRVRRGTRWWLALVLLATGTGLLAPVAFEVAGRMPGILSWALHRIVPGIELEVGAARFEPGGQLSADQVRLSLRDADAPFFTAERVEIGFAWAEVFAGRLRELRLVRPTATWSEGSRGELPSVGEGQGSVSWSIGRLRASDGHVAFTDSASDTGVASVKEIGRAHV